MTKKRPRRPFYQKNHKIILSNSRDAARDYIAIAKQYNMLESVVYTGKRTVDFTYLLEKSGEYVVYAVGYRNASTDKGLTTEIQSQAFTYKAK